MKTKSQIQYLSRSAIDLQKWNACIDKASTGLIYGNSLFLDTLCTHWDALVLNDYEAVMPLPWRSKWGIRYLYQPAFIQQLGVFGIPGHSEEKTALFLEKAMEHFSYGEVNLNSTTSSLNATQRDNYILPLNRAYALIASGYRADLIKNLKKSERQKLQYKSGTNAAEVLQRYKKQYQREMKFTNEDYTKMLSLCQHPQYAGRVLIRLVLQDTALMSACLCLRDSNRIYFLVSVNTTAGRKLSANHFLLDQLIREFAGQSLLLDFEGSDNTGIAHFYKNFGALPRPYYFYRWNHLPWPFRLLKPVSPLLKKNEALLNSPLKPGV